MDRHPLEFKALRDSYIIVKKFIEEESGADVKSLSTKIERDLLLSGDDNFELLEKFIIRFNLNYDSFDYSKHFESEGELADTTLYSLLKLIGWIPLKIIELISFNKLKIIDQDFWDPPRKTLDLSFRDMLTWYIEGKYKLGSELKYEIKRAS